jgi:hypothetical protein
VIDAFAVGALCGVPPERVVRAGPLERELYLRVIARASELRVQMMKAEASHIGNAVGKVFGGR